MYADRVLGPIGKAVTDIFCNSIGIEIASILLNLKALSSSFISFWIPETTRSDIAREILIIVNFSFDILVITPNVWLPLLIEFYMVSVPVSVPPQSIGKCLILPRLYPWSAPTIAICQEPYSLKISRIF